jgi:hypothetical protein
MKTLTETDELKRRFGPVRSTPIRLFDSRLAIGERKICLPVKKYPDGLLLSKLYQMLSLGSYVFQYLKTVERTSFGWNQSTPRINVLI